MAFLISLLTGLRCAVTLEEAVRTDLQVATLVGLPLQPCPVSRIISFTRGSLSATPRHLCAPILRCKAPHGSRTLLPHWHE